MEITSIFIVAEKTTVYGEVIFMIIRNKKGSFSHRENITVINILMEVLKIPIKIGPTQSPDPFIMKKDQVNAAILNFLECRGFGNVELLNENGQLDLRAERKNWTLYIETRGSQARTHNSDTVFNSTQLWIHLYEQVGYMMKFYQHVTEPSILVLGNPDIPRLRNNVDSMRKALDKMDVVRFWVQEDGNVQVDAPHHMKDILTSLGIG